MNFLDIAKYMALATDLIKAVTALIESNKEHTAALKENTEVQRLSVASLNKENENAG